MTNAGNVDSCRDEFIVWDTEYWADKGARERRWEGLCDCHPLLIQIGALRVRTVGGSLTIEDEFQQLILPEDQFGNIPPITQYFCDLTGLSADRVFKDGRELRQVLEDFHDFCGDRLLWAYGVGDIRNMALSCYLAGIDCPISPSACHDVRRIFFQTGLSEEFLMEHSSGNIAAAVGAPAREFRGHDALEDCRSIVAALAFMADTGKLPPITMAR